VRIEQRSAGKSCIDRRRWLDAKGNVIAEEKDSSGNCEFDTWNYYEGGRLVRQGHATSGGGSADVLSHFDSQGALRIQELVSLGGKRPDKKLFLDASGRIVKHCADGDGNGSLEMLLEFDGEKPSVAVVDTDGDGFADEREVFEDGRHVRLDTDTNGDHRPDVVQYFEGEDITRQDEDSDFDGRIDTRFEGEKPVPLLGPTEAPPQLPELGCGRFHDFWRR
jgi:hypothetical protein